MRYYLETNALYSIEKILAKNIKNIYTSIFALYELITGITKDKFAKRKNILQKVINSEIVIDWEMPEQIIFKSFNVTQDYEFIEERVIPLKKLIKRLIESNTYSDFIASYEYKDQKYNFEYFLKLDENWNKKFIDATNDGNNKVKEIINLNQKKFIIDHQEYEIRKSIELESFFDNESLLNRSITIYAIVKMLKKLRIIDLEEEKIYNSYNGLIDYYIDGFTNYSSNKMTKLDSAAFNDIVDLNHLLYIRNECKNFIVSNDKIFTKILSKQIVKIDKLIY